MIIPNGYIEIKSKSVGGMDEDGYPIPAKAVWEEPIRCQIVPNRSTLLGVTGQGAGEPFTVAEYSILVNENEYPEKPFEQIRLTDDGGKSLGEYSVKKVRHLSAVSQYEITV